MQKVQAVSTSVRIIFMEASLSLLIKLRFSAHHDETVADKRVKKHKNSNARTLFHWFILPREKTDSGYSSWKHYLRLCLRSVTYLSFSRNFSMSYKKEFLHSDFLL